MEMFAVVSIYLMTSSVIAYLMSDAQPNPYMDEIFHVPQVQQYCQGNFSAWDPMITTLPGLYLVTVGLLKPAQYLLSIPLDSVCSTFNLRAVNILFMAGNLYMMYSIYMLIHPQDKDKKQKAVMTSLTLSLFPILYFFTFLYYTDPGSTFFVLLMYYYHLYDFQFLSALMGAVAILFRQTNIVWVIFISGLTARDCIIQSLNAHIEKEKQEEIDLEDDLKLIITTLKLCISPTKFLSLLFSILRKGIWLILVTVGFLIFIYVNGSIVVGDKSHHEACLNFPQIFYFASIVLIFSGIHLISPMKVLNFLKFVIFKFYISIPSVLIAYFLISKYTYVHIYLLSDNRHYTFYVWARIFERHSLVRFLLIPVYLYGLWGMLSNLSHLDALWRLVYIICIMAASIPQKLMEFRYFILPYLIFRLNLKCCRYLNLFIEMLMYLFVNVFTLYMYHQKPFKWPDHEGLQRFMW